MITFGDYRSSLLYYRSDLRIFAEISVIWSRNELPSPHVGFIPADPVEYSPEPTAHTALGARDRPTARSHRNSQFRRAA